MKARVNVARSSLCVVLLLLLILVAFKIFGRQSSMRTEVKRKMFPKSLSQALHTYKHKSRSQKISDSYVRPSRKQHNGKPVRSEYQMLSQPLIGPVIKELYQKWKKAGKIFYREIIPINGPPRLDVLLLHGRKFSSADWVKLKTMNILSASGFHVIAMDLPGYGQSKGYRLQDKTDKRRAKFLDKFIQNSKLVSPVIVSPSWSGRYLLPYIAGLKQAKTMVGGFVAIAVEGTDRLPQKAFKHFHAPALLMRGSKDLNLGIKSVSMLHHFIPSSMVKVIQGAGHVCYQDKPKEFHETLVKFLDDVAKNKVSQKKQKVAKS